MYNNHSPTNFKFLAEHEHPNEERKRSQCYADNISRSVLCGRKCVGCPNR